MGASGRGQYMRRDTSNRAPFYTDAVVSGEGGLLAANATKTITLPLNVAGLTRIAESVRISNKSGKKASVNLIVAVSYDATATEPMINPIELDAGEVVTIDCRVVAIVETNIDSATQTGQGVCYLFTLESDYRTN